MNRAIVAIVLVSTSAAGQPNDPDKGNAKALMQSGLKLFAAKDYLGALAVFKDAYARFPSGKILLNIGTTLVKLDRPAEAANAYQGYLDSPDVVDPAKRAEAVRVLADLDKRVGLLEITTTPSDAELELAGEWKPAADLTRTRVAPGEIAIKARRATYKPLTRTVTARAGATETVALVLELEPVATVPVPTGEPGPGPGVTRRLEPESRSRLGAIALAHVDPSNGGGAAVVGLALAITERVNVRAAAILGPYVGGYAGASVALLTGRVRPIVAVALPMFRSEGMRFAVRGAGGVELQLSHNFAMVAELGVEHLLNPQDSVTSPTLFVPALGLRGQL